MSKNLMALSLLSSRASSNRMIFLQWKRNLSIKDIAVQLVTTRKKIDQTVLQKIEEQDKENIINANIYKCSEYYKYNDMSFYDIEKDIAACSYRQPQPVSNL
nr:uncharacterized protein LOC105846506 [Hydra vulgaris]